MRTQLWVWTSAPAAREVDWSEVRHLLGRFPLKAEGNVGFVPGSCDVWRETERSWFADLSTGSCAAPAGATRPAPSSPTPGPGALPACGSNDQLGAALVPVNAACCDEPTEDCSSGYPASCNPGCAAVLLPVQMACEDFLREGGARTAVVRQLLEDAAARCPAAGGSGH